MNQNRPNILLAVADDASHMSAYGHRFLSTPHFDRVARDGVLFTQAFTTNPKCAPSRASILTGRHTWELEEACDHFNVWPAKFPVYPDMLADAGYFVGLTGKGWGPGDWQRQGRSTNPAGPKFERNRLTVPEGSHVTPKDYAADFKDFLDERPADTPFCFWYGAHEPHRPYTPGEGRAHGKNVQASDVPDYLPSEPAVQADLEDYAFEVEWFDAHLGRMLEELEQRGELENTFVLVTSDNGMPFPRVKGNMYDDDFRLPMAMMWLGAESRFGASARRPGEAAEYAIPGTQRTARGGRIRTDIVSFIDIAPTILEVAGLGGPRAEAHPSMTGRSFLELFCGAQLGRYDPARDRACMGRERHDLGREGDVGYPVRCIRTDEWLYVRNFKPELWPAGNPETGYTGCDSSPTKDHIIEQHAKGDDRFFDLAFGKRPAEELYRIDEDPECMRNLSDVKDYAEVKRALWDELRGYLKAQRDPRILGRGDVFDSYEYVGKATHSWSHYLAGTWEPQSY